MPTTRPIDPVTRPRIAAYAEAVGDHNPMHLDEHFAQQAGFPSVIAHGPLTVAIALDAALADQDATPRKVEARLAAPVFPDQQLHLVETEAGHELRSGDNETILLTFKVTPR